MNIKELKDLITLMNENELTELEIEKEGMRIKLRKGSGGVIEKVTEVVQGRISPPLTVAPETASVEKKNIVEIKAPMVGTLYRSPSPDAPPYVENGDAIVPGQVICILEAMKLMNEIKSEIKGKIVDIPVENGQPVEYGQVMFVVELT